MAPTPGSLAIEIAPAAALSWADSEAIAGLCHRAYGEPIPCEEFPTPHHVVGWYDGGIVSHAMWVTRWLQVGGDSPLRTAYVEAVATDPSWQRRGFASAIMQALGAAVADFELAALAPALEGFYERLGWETWQGPLFIRSPDGPLATPHETVMILRLPRSPRLDLSSPLSAEWRTGELW